MSFLECWVHLCNQKGIVNIKKITILFEIVLWDSTGIDLSNV